MLVCITYFFVCISLLLTFFLLCVLCVLNSTFEKSKTRPSNRFCSLQMTKPIKARCLIQVFFGKGLLYLYIWIDSKSILWDFFWYVSDINILLARSHEEHKCFDSVNTINLLIVHSARTYKHTHTHTWPNGIWKPLLCRKYVLQIMAHSCSTFSDLYRFYCTVRIGLN